MTDDSERDWYERLSHLGDQVFEANKLATEADGDQLVDLAGELASVIRRFGDVKKLAASELGDADKGRRWQVSIPQKANRTYSMRLLTTLALEGETPTDTLLRLISFGVITIEWKWTQLNNLAKAQESTLVIRKGKAVGVDDADADVGEQWDHGYASYHPIGGDE